MKSLRWLAAAIGIGTVPPRVSNPAPDQAVIVRFSYGSTDLSRLFELESKLESAITNAKAGEFAETKSRSMAATASFTCMVRMKTACSRWWSQS